MDASVQKCEPALKNAFTYVANPSTYVAENGFPFFFEG
jgi:hypothetical protein